MSAWREPRKKDSEKYYCKREVGLQATDPHCDVGLPKGLLDDLHTLIEETRTRVATAVNVETLMLNWRLGQRIWREILGEERAEYGKRIVYALSRQLSLTRLRDLDLLVAKGKGKGTYYIPGSTLNALIEPVEVEEGGSIRELSNQLPAEISDRLDTLGKRTSDKERLRELIILLCKWKPLSIKQLCELTKRSRKHLSHHYIKPLLNSGILEYTIPDMPNHPNQTYRTIKKEH